MPPHRSRACLVPRLLLLAALALPAGCGRPAAEVGSEATVPSGDERLDPAALEQGRLDPAWRDAAALDRSRRDSGPEDPAAPPAGPAAPGAERFEQIRAETTNYRPALPLGPWTEAGPSVLHVQILLDRALFSPGALDGRWGKNTEKAVYWLQHAAGLPATGTVDSLTYEHLATHAAAPPVERYTLSAEDLSGPFLEVPDDIYDKAELDCLCYRSPLEKLAETFHVTPDLLEQLNLGFDFSTLESGMQIWAPTLRAPSRPGEADGQVARIVVSRTGFYTQALDADGNILFHFPSTLGAEYSPSPEGEFHVTSVTHDPTFKYQPRLFHDVPDDDPEVMLRPGPNSPVGVVWMALSKPHYGIHGTAEPQTIGYASSAGCVRLTNWDAKYLADHTRPGTPVEFR